MRLARLLLASALALAAPPAMAGSKNCGTIVLPSGVGVAGSADITSFNPLFGNSLYNAQAASLLYLGLIWVDRDQKIDWARSLASAIEPSPDGTRYLVTLRPWHWSDGVPVTSADVAYTFRLIKQLGPLYAGFGAGGMPDIVKSLTVIDPTHFEVTLKRPANPTWFIYNGLAQLLPLPEHDWGRSTLDQIMQAQSTEAFFSVVDGPLKLARLDFGLDLVMVPNPAYEGPKLHFSRFVFKFLQNDGAAVQGVRSGALDMANVPDPLWNAVRHIPGTRLVALPPAHDFSEIALNLRNPDVAFFKDVRVRQAMADAIDQRTLIDLLYHGAGVAIHGPVPPSLKNFLAPELRAGRYPTGYDPARARALLAAAGYAPGRDGIMQKDGAKIEFTYLMIAGGAMSQEIAELLQDFLKKVGIEMKIREIEFNQLLALLNDPSGKGWQAAGLGETMGGFPSGEFLFATGAFGNAGGYSDRKMDDLIRASTEKPGLDALFDYELYAAAQQPVIFFGRPDILILARDRLKGIEDFVDPAGQYAPDELYCTSQTR